MAILSQKIRLSFLLWTNLDILQVEKTGKFQYFCKITEVKLVFLVEYLFQPNRTKSKEKSKKHHRRDLAKHLFHSWKKIIHNMAKLRFI
jgi:hypothetical protein